MLSIIGLSLSLVGLLIAVFMFRNQSKELNWAQSHTEEIERIRRASLRAIARRAQSPDPMMRGLAARQARRFNQEQRWLRGEEEGNDPPR